MTISKKNSEVTCVFDSVCVYDGHEFPILARISLPTVVISIAN